MEIKITRLITDLTPSEISGSIAERGKNAAEETWANANAAAAETPLMTEEERKAAREWFREFGAWSKEELEAMSGTEIDALLLQYAAGDVREAQSLCPGDGLGEIDWEAAEKLSEEGTIGGRIYASGNDLYIYVGS